MEKKIIKICIFLIIIIIVFCFGYVARKVYLAFESLETKYTEIPLSNISEDEKNKLIELDILELEEYPSSIEFLKLTKKSEVRESQYYIEFMVNKDETQDKKIERHSNIADDTNIIKIAENNEYITYRYETNFTSNSKPKKFDYLYELINIYNNNNTQSSKSVENSVSKEKDESKKKLEEMKNNFNNGVDNLDTTIFLKDFENYNPTQSTDTITENKAKEIAQKGFEESAKRITHEGADNIESETIRVMEKYANNYFTAYYAEPSKEYENIKRKCYVFNRENEIGNGIMIYVDMQTGLIIGGGAFGD